MYQLETSGLRPVKGRLGFAFLVANRTIDVRLDIYVVCRWVGQVYRKELRFHFDSLRFDIFNDGIFLWKP